MRINSELYQEISNFLICNTHENELNDLNDLPVCKALFEKFVGDIVSQNELIILNIRVKYARLIMLPATLYRDSQINELFEDFIIETKMDNDAKGLGNHLILLLNNSTFFPIDKALKEKVFLFLQKHISEKLYFDVDDKNEAKYLLQEIENLIFNPIRKYDKNFDIKLNKFKDEFEFNRYLFEVGQKLGRDNEAEELRGKLFYFISFADTHKRLDE